MRGVVGEVRRDCDKLDPAWRDGGEVEEVVEEAGELGDSCSREKYAGRLERLRLWRLLEIVESSRPLWCIGRTVALRECFDDADEDREMGGTSDRSSSADADAPIGLLTGPAKGLEIDEARLCKRGIVDRWFVVDGRRAYRREDAA